MVFILEGAAENEYKAGHPSLQGRAAFVYSNPGTPEAAFVILNNPVGSFSQIQQRVGQGYIVRTRSDEFHPTAYSTARRDTALRSAAQIISTDFYPQAPQQTPDGKAVQFPDQSLWRCHPLLTTSSCVVSE